MTTPTTRPDDPRPRVLLVSYPFPPVGGAGVQRVTKFAKYLPHAGWLPSVLTVANPSVPVTDHSLAADIPEGTIIRRARTREPGYALKSAVSEGAAGTGRRGGPVAAAKGLARRTANLLLQPDPQILWAPDALRQGTRLLREITHDAIVATGPPFSTFLIAARLSRRAGLPLVLDYRDEWGLSNTVWENKRLDSVSLKIQASMQHRAVRQARALVATTQASARTLEHIRDQARSQARVDCLYNGYDPDDFPPEPPVPRPADAPCRIVYAGTLWSLTSVAPLVDAVLDLARRRPDLAGRLELIFAGRRTGPQQEHLDRLEGSPARRVEHAYLDHATALDLVRSADVLCVLLSDLPGAERVVPAKLFEAMAARRPILVIAPEGETWSLLDGYPAAHTHQPGDVAGITNTLAHAIEHRERPDFSTWDDSRFNRKHQARQLAAILDAIR